ncbi:phosphatase [Geotalea uraniireducens]|uniref:PHP C-terminal domain protein n=1 Tax=Geotalea uraniireducens (strain Rf4) TaxID=351605 RepID=A5G9C8_GEOUR|nr:phosphatase [Geotalea uraniireducens]ABQ28396.1 PHP C-terminal domain protein [Geotalea uraniireducens Rf4]
MELIADMHTHTIASGHAYSTVNELADAAASIGLKAIALTDHGPALPGGPHLYHFGAMRFIPRELFGVRIFLGVEANILDIDGSIDLTDRYQERLDFVMAGLHEGCGFDNQGIERNSEAVINAMANPRIKAISHPGNPVFPLDYETVVKASLETGTALEINNSSLGISREGSRPNCEKLAALIARYGSPLVIGSDAHIAQGVGVFDDALALLAKTGINESQVVNSSMARLLAFLELDA